MSGQAPQPDGERGSDDESSRVPRSPAPGRAPEAPLGDARCLKCGYNLRGLIGRYVRCPECFHVNQRDLVSGEAAARRHMRELQGAGDAILLAVIFFIVAAALAYFDRRPMLALPVVAIGGLLMYQGVAVSRRLGREIEDWSSHWTRYLVLTIFVPCAPLALWLVSAIVVWSVRTGGEKSSGLDFVDIFVAIAPTIVLLFTIRPLRRLRASQKLAFARLVRLTIGRRFARRSPPETTPM